MKQSTILYRISYHKNKLEYYEGLLLNGGDQKRRQIVKKPTSLEMQEIQRICREHNVLDEEFFSGRKDRFIVKARADACHLFRSKGYTLSRTAMLLGYDDHTSVVYLLKKYKSKYDSTIQQ